MTCRRRLTANGPAAAYDIVMSSQRKPTQGKGRANTASAEGIFSSQDNDWSLRTRHGAARKKLNMGTSESPIRNETTPEEDGGSGRHSPYMRFQTQRAPRPRSTTGNETDVTTTKRRKYVDLADDENIREEEETPRPGRPEVQRRDSVNNEGPMREETPRPGRSEVHRRDSVNSERPIREEIPRPGRSEVHRRDSMNSEGPIRDQIVAWDRSRNPSRVLDSDPSRQQPDDMANQSPCRQRTDTPDAFERLHYKAMIEQVKEYKSTVANLQRIQTGVLHKIVELPRHCRWECVSKVLTDVVSSFLLGSDAECTLYPSEHQLIPRILQAFGVGMNDRDKVEQFFTQWGKGGQESIMGKVFDNIRDRRGAILRVLREEFYAQLGTPKPRDGSDIAVTDWKDRLASLRRNREWRSDSEGDRYDPWGTLTIHHSISRVLKGIRYDKECPISISVHQAGFFFHNLELAMEGRVMEASRMHLHHRCMSEMEEKVKGYRKDMSRIRIVME